MSGVVSGDGGPAFGHGNPTDGGSQGMSLRDWFAGQLAVPFVRALVKQGYSDTVSQSQVESVAIHAYGLADAMLQERGRSGA